MKSSFLGRRIAGLVVCTLLAAPLAASAQQNPPRFAVWDPQAGTIETRFRLDPAELDKAAAALTQGGLQVDRVTAAQIADPAAFSAAKFDALFLPGDTFPQSDLAALKRFADDGGVLIGMRTLVPFLIAIEPDADGRWTMTPKAPTFAWQKYDVMSLFGLKYNFKPELHDSGTVHEPTPLLKSYLPSAATLKSKMPGLWIYPVNGAEMYPLLRSRRPDGADVTPQIYVAKQDRHLAILIADGFVTRGVPGFAKPEETLVALAKLASDLKRGKVQLDPATKLVSLDKLSIPGPLENRPGTASTNPDGAKPVIRWGRFNGSSLDLDPAGTPGKLTRSLAPGSSVTLPLADVTWPAGQPVFMRVRGAFNQQGAGMKVSLQSAGGEQVLRNEILNYIDSKAPSNFNGALAGMATEFTRLAFVAPMVKPTALVISNPGTSPVYFDAAQLETRPAPMPDRIIALGAGTPKIPASYSQTWTNIRVNPRPQFVGPPGDPKRWEKMDKLMAEAYAANPHLQLVLEGTPPWAPISPERYELGTAANRPHTVPPDTEKFAQLVTEIIQRYGDRVESYEVWNEPDIQQFWRGTSAEYVSFFKTITPLIRKLAPKARVISAGMSGFKDPWVEDMVAGNVPQDADLFAFHPYAGKSAGWDIGYGLVQGALLSRGQDREVFCDESGLPSKNTQWFQPPPVLTPAAQANMLNIAISRVLGGDLAKLSVFNAGGDGNEFGLFDGSGKPMPAYDVFATYVALGQPGARRQDVAITSVDGKPLQGVYTAASSYPDGSVAIVVNPSEVESLQPSPDPSTDFNSLSGWTTFFGKSTASQGIATVTPDEGKKNAGFYTQIVRDPAKYRYLEVNAPESDGGYDLILKLPDGKAIPAVTAGVAGVWRGDLDQLLPPGARNFELSFRVFGRTTFDSIKFLPSEKPVAAATSIPVKLCVPLTANVSANAQSLGRSVPVKIEAHSVGGQSWAELQLDISGRTLVELKPANK